jgi:hypothetical protein
MRIRLDRIGDDAIESAVLALVETREQQRRETCPEADDEYAK